jgi:hypothetical protein
VLVELMDEAFVMVTVVGALLTSWPPARSSDEPVRLPSPL